MNNQSKDGPGEAHEIKAFTRLPDGSFLLHRGNIDDLAARGWQCDRSYQTRLERHWKVMLPLYSACYAVGRIQDFGPQRACYELYDDLVRAAGGIPTTAALIDGCCAIADVSLIPMERLLHIRRVKEIFSLKVIGQPPIFD